MRASIVTVGYAAACTALVTYGPERVQLPAMVALLVVGGPVILGWHLWHVLVPALRATRSVETRIRSRRRG